MKLDLEYFCPRGKRRRIGLRKILSKKKKGERESDLE